MPRYIDANKLNKKKKYQFETQGMPFPKSEWFIKADDFFAAPTEDVMKVVRCKDCKYAKEIKRYGCACQNTKTPWFNDEFEVYMNHDDFCSYGEREE